MQRIGFESEVHHPYRTGRYQRHQREILFELITVELRRDKGVSLLSSDYQDMSKLLNIALNL